MQEHNQKFPGFWQALGILALLVFLEILIGLTLSGVGFRYTPGDPRGSIIVVLGCGIVLSVLLAYKRLDYRRLFSPWNRPFLAVVLPIVLPLVLVCAGSYLLSWELANLASRVFPPPEEFDSDMSKLLSGGFVSLMALVVIAPFVEEMLFRGIFLRGFLNNYAPWPAILLSALIFGLMHLTLAHVATATTLGIVFGWLYYTTGSLWPPILAHAFHNGITLLYARSFPDSLSEVDPTSFPMFPLPILLGAVFALLFGMRRIFVASAERTKDAG